MSSLPTRPYSNQSPRAKPLALLYISPAFPSTSLVFEQNELLGLLRNDVELRIYSCRRPRKNRDYLLHEFAAELNHYAKYFTWLDCGRGTLFALRYYPHRLFAATWHSLIALLLAPRRAIKNLAALIGALCCLREIKARKIAWIHADFSQGSAAVAYILSLLTGVPFSFSCHSWDLFDPRAGKRDHRFVYAKRLKAAAFVTAVFQGGVDYLKTLDAGGDKQRAEEKIILHRVSVRIVEATPLAYPPKTRLQRVIAMGRLVPQKGFAHLLSALSILRQRGHPVVLEIFGDGPLRESLQFLASSLGIEAHVTFHGVYRQSQLKQIFSDASVLVVPSIVADQLAGDAIPTVIYEAMAYGVPVVASAIGGIAEVVIQGRTGVLIPPGDELAIAESIAGIISQPERAQRLAANARRYVEVEHDNLRQGQRLIEEILKWGKRSRMGLK